MFILVNTVYNYFLCVTTSNKGSNYDRVVRELAEASNFTYPETYEEIASFRMQFEQKIADRRLQLRQRQMAAAASQNNGSTIPRSIPYSWMLLGPQEWGYCFRSNQPKPPRAHYDHVTSTLVLNMDHFCPWMFNTVGYFNYRYFVNFLIYVCVGMLYGAFITYIPFRNISSTHYKEQSNIIRVTKKSIQRMYPLVPMPSEKTSIALTFMLCLSIGIAVLCLLLFHLYLLLTGQTTVEFHGNWANKRRAKRRGTTWINPYDLGYEDNWKFVYGNGHFIKALLLPSSRQPQFLPIPINGQLIKRHPKADKETTTTTIVIQERKQTTTLLNGTINGNNGTTNTTTIEHHNLPFNV